MEDEDEDEDEEEDDDQEDEDEDEDEDEEEDEDEDEDEDGWLGWQGTVLYCTVQVVRVLYCIVLWLGWQFLPGNSATPGSNRMRIYRGYKVMENLATTTQH